MHVLARQQALSGRGKCTRGGCGCRRAPRTRAGVYLQPPHKTSLPSESTEKGERRSMGLLPVARAAGVGHVVRCAVGRHRSCMLLGCVEAES